MTEPKIASIMVVDDEDELRHALYERLAALQPSLKVLYMSGYTAHAAVRANLLKAGGPLLRKPFEPIELARQVRRSLDTGDRP